MLSDRYQLKRRLGQGGMARVFLAEDTTLGRTVAIKQLHDELDGDDEVRKRFMREARIFAKLKHPHIVDIYDVVPTEGGGVAMVMEFIDGTDLQTVLKGGLRLVPELAALVVRPVAEALAYAHSQGVVHRDVKPANVLLGKDGTIKLSDFGIAKAQEETVLTQTGDFLGTPAYIAPEQARGELIGPAADQYALGAVLFELVTGQQPFRAPNTLAVLTKIMSGDYPDPRTLSEAVDDHLAGIIARALSLEVKDRYPDLPALTGALQAYHHEVSRDREKRLVSELVANPTSTSEVVAGEVADEMVVTGRQALEQGDLGRARKAAAAALARRPGHVQAEALLRTIEESGPPAAMTASPSPGAGRSRLPLVVAAVALAVVVGLAVGAIRRSGGPEATPDAAPTLAAVADAAVAPADPSPDAAHPDAAQPDARLADAAPRPVDAASPKVARRKRPRPPLRRAKPEAPPPPEPLIDPAPEPKRRPPLDRPTTPGKLAIATAPWADVYVDGKKKGRTPYLRELSLPAGTYRLELRNPGFPPHQETLVVKSGETVKRRVRLGRSR